MTPATTVHVCADGGETILEALHRYGLTLDAPCRGGGCGVCRVRVVSGSVQHGPHTRRALSDSDREDGIALACRATPDAGNVVFQPLTRGLRNRFGHWSVSYAAPAVSQRKRSNP